MLTIVAFVILIYLLIPINLNIVRRFPSTNQLIPPLRLCFLYYTEDASYSNVNLALLKKSKKRFRTLHQATTNETNKQDQVSQNQSHLYIDFTVKLEFKFINVVLRTSFCREIKDTFSIQINFSLLGIR